MDTGAPVTGSAVAVLRRIFVFLTHPLGVVAVVACLIFGLLVADLARSAFKAASLARQLKESEAGRLEAEGVAVAERASQRALLAEADRIQAELAVLSKQLGEKPKVREVVKWRTETVTVAAPSGREVTCPHGEVVPCPDCPEVRVSVAGVSASLETAENNVIVTGKVDIVRESPPPREVVASVPYEVTGAFAAKPEPVPPRWSLGPAVALQDGRAAFGAAAVGPRVRMWRVEARPVFQAVADKDGAVTASAALVFGVGR